jgi:hypothetical protein
MSVSQRMGWTLAAAIVGFAAPTCTAGAPAAGPPAILSVTPAAAPIGTRITLVGINFTPDNNTVEIGGGYIQWLRSIGAGAGERAISFVLTPGVAAARCPDAVRCPTPIRPVRPGPQDLRVLNANGVSTATAFSVTP